MVIVPSATLPDNIIMNGIKYPSEEIEKGYKSLNRSPAPLGWAWPRQQVARDEESGA